MSTIQQLCLIDKVLREGILIKIIISKCMMEWQLEEEVSIVDMGNSFSLIKFINENDCNRVYEGQPWLVYKDGKKDSDLVKESLHSAHLWVQLPRLPLSFRMNLLWKKFLNLSRKPTKLMLILKFSPKPFLHEYVWK